MIEQFGYKQELKRALSFWDLLVYGLIFMVPIAPFGVYGYVADASKGMVALAYLIGMAGMIFTALSYARMSEAFPVAGSVYAYAQRGIHETVGFFSGWAILLDYILIPSLCYVVSANALTSLVPTIPAWVWIVLFLAVNTVINVRGVEFTARANKIMLIILFAVLVLFLIAGVTALLGSGGFTVKPIYDAEHFDLNLVMSAVSIAVLSFLGFDAISTLSEEVKGGSKAVGRASVTALFTVGFLFIAQTWVASDLGRGMQFDSLDTAFYEIAGAAGGVWLKTVSILATVLSWGISAALVAQAAISRILFSMGRDRKLPAVLAKVHPRYQTPYVSTVLVAVVSLIVSLGFQDHMPLLTNLVNFGALTSFVVLHLSVIVHFTIRQKSRQVVAHLLCPLIGMSVIAYVLTSMDPLAIKAGIAWLALGAVYLFIRSRVFKDKSTTLEL
ncbi:MULTISPECIES: APC family permease [Bacillales]|mgnify:FL=1|jgi:amino acid transporter|uniref:Amino acid permease n=1 Tax=Brevibacillus aydinogluensis TaxID=927786 RepID=A0AA48RHC4_9BACL|nr:MULTISPECIES: APC family permease [Bacillales]REK63065.1 MAG: amino acid permease [Brevibacillus sp.]MDT3414647.1 amino acid transporter [Brevibacillus aydinogluensis]NNV03992.1 APC family permease [Brevibacillus sp. MCWH]UFJ61006.1 APC family permease [Anoxybacillus sediminis]CAJ1002179.1 Amino acid permease [Brevibacillus aydinogluensis]